MIQSRPSPPRRHDVCSGRFSSVPGSATACNPRGAARRPVAKTHPGRDQPVADLRKGKNAQHRDRRQLQQLTATLPFEFFIFESSDHNGPSREPTLAQNEMRMEGLSFKVVVGYLGFTNGK